MLSFESREWRESPRWPRAACVTLHLRQLCGVTTSPLLTDPVRYSDLDRLVTGIAALSPLTLPSRLPLSRRPSLRCVWAAGMNADKPKLILWSPALLDHFIVVSSSIRLYQSTAAAREHLQQSHDLATAGSGHPDKQQGQPRSPPLVAASPSPSPSPSPFRLLDTVSYPQHSIRAVAWTTSASDPLLVAAGLLSGKLALIRFREEVRVVKEFDPRYQRACHAVAWSAHWEERVAVGLDRVRNSPGTLVWDIHSKGRAAAASQPQQQQAAAAAASPFPSSLSSSLTMSIAHHQSPTECVTEALLGVSNSEASLSLAWWPLHPACLAVGTGFKCQRTAGTARSQTQSGAEPSRARA